MTNVVGLDYAKPILNFQGTVDDDLLETVIGQAEAIVVEKYGPLVATALTKRVIARGGKLVLPVVPVISVTTVTAVQSGTVVDVTDANLVNLRAGVIAVTGVSDGVAFDVAYQAGPTTTPEALKRVVVETARYLWRPLQGPVVNGQTVDASMAALRMAEMLAAPYRAGGFA